MKKYNVVRLAEAGFTLVELMIVVAIIGILASIAIPNFQKYQAKARQKEAQLGLASIFTAETSNYGEFSTYTSCLVNAGYRPEGLSTAAGILSGRRYYAIGVTSAGVCTGPSWGGTAAFACSVNGVTQACSDAALNSTMDSSPSNYVATLAAGKAPIALGTQVTAASTLTATTFTAAAVGSNGTAPAGIWDTWTIDQGKLMNNTVSGL